MAGAYTISLSGTYTLPNPSNGTAPTSAPYNGTAIPNLSAGDSNPNRPGCTNHSQPCLPL